MFDLAAAVTDVEQAIDRLARGLEPALVPASSALQLVPTVAKAERQLAGVKMRLAGRVAETPVWKHQGHRSPAHWLAGQSKTSVAEAVGVLETAARLVELPATCEAIRDGLLSRPQAAVIADAAAVAPNAEHELLSLAGRESLDALKAEAARRKVAHLDENEQYERIRASRHVRFGTEPDGAATMSVRATNDVMAEIRAGLAHFQGVEFESARRAGRRDPFEAYAVDGLQAMTRAAVGGAAGGSGPTGRVATKVIIRVDHAALSRGRRAAGEVCEATGVGPLPVGRVQQLLLSGDVFAAAVVTEPSGQVTTVAHLGHRPRVTATVALDALLTEGHDVTSSHGRRRPNAYQRTALEWTSPTCSVAGCDQPRHEIDHRTGWAVTHETGLDDLDGLCRFHHRLKTREGFGIEPGVGRRELRPPTGRPPRQAAHAPP